MTTKKPSTKSASKGKQDTGGDSAPVGAIGKQHADQIRSIPIKDIIVNARVQVRAKTSTETIEEYRAAMLCGDAFPPVEVVEGGDGIILWDGFQRHEAARQTKKIKELQCRVQPGWMRDAILLAVGANATHGLRRTASDKQIAVTRLLYDSEWGRWADREIARKCHVSPTFVGELRAGMKKGGSLSTADSESRTYTNKHGATATMRTGNIGRGKREAEPPPVSAETEPRGGAAEPSLSDADAAADAAAAAKQSQYHVVNGERMPVELSEAALRGSGGLRADASVTPPAAASGELLTHMDGVGRPGLFEPTASRRTESMTPEHETAAEKLVELVWFAGKADAAKVGAHLRDKLDLEPIEKLFRWLSEIEAAVATVVTVDEAVP